MVKENDNYNLTLNKLTVKDNVLLNIQYKKFHLHIKSIFSFHLYHNSDFSYYIHILLQVNNCDGMSGFIYDIIDCMYM